MYRLLCSIFSPGEGVRLDDNLVEAATITPQNTKCQQDPLVQLFCSDLTSAMLDMNSESDSEDYDSTPLQVYPEVVSARVLSEMEAADGVRIQTKIKHNRGSGKDDYDYDSPGEYESITHVKQRFKQKFRKSVNTANSSSELAVCPNDISFFKCKRAEFGDRYWRHRCVSEKQRRNLKRRTYHEVSSDIDKTRTEAEQMITIVGDRELLSCIRLYPGNDDSTLEFHKLHEQACSSSKSEWKKIRPQAVTKDLWVQIYLELRDSPSSCKLDLNHNYSYFCDSDGNPSACGTYSISGGDVNFECPRMNIHLGRFQTTPIKIEFRPLTLYSNRRVTEQIQLMLSIAKKKHQREIQHSRYTKREDFSWINSEVDDHGRCHLLQ